MLTTLTLLLLWVGIATYADTCFKAAGRFGDWRFLIGLACYASTSFLAVLTFSRQQWGWIVIVWNCLSLALSLALSVGLFHERFTFRRGVAALLVLTAIFLAE